MDVITRVIRRVVLYYPVYPGDVKSSRGDVRTEKNPGLGVAEFEERVCPFLLLLLALYCETVVSTLWYHLKSNTTYMEIKYGNVNIIEQLSVIFHGITAREEHDDFLLHVFSEEGEEEEEAAVGGANNVALR